MFGIVELDTAIFMIVKKENIDGFDVLSTPVEAHGFIRVDFERGVAKSTSYRHISKEVLDSGKLQSLRLEAKKHAESYWGRDI